MNNSDLHKRCLTLVTRNGNDRQTYENLGGIITYVSKLADEVTVRIENTFITLPAKSVKVME